MVANARFRSKRLAIDIYITRDVHQVSHWYPYLDPIHTHIRDINIFTTVGLISVSNDGTWLTHLALTPKALGPQYPVQSMLLTGL